MRLKSPATMQTAFIFVIFIKAVAHYLAAYTQAG
jgi:hypothetical protein